MRNLSLRIKSRLGWLKNSIAISKLRLYNKSWRIPVINLMGFDTAIGKTTEPWIYHILLELHQSRKLDAFIDIGVNTGQTLIKIKSIDDKIPYYGFEPNPNCVYYLQYLQEQNDLQNVTFSCFALGNVQGTTEMHFLGDEDTRATILKTETTPTDLIHHRLVAVTTLDQVNPDIPVGKTVVLKIDVEGFELEVIKGALHFISKHRPIILFEVLPHNGSQNCKSRAIELFQTIEKQRYQLFRINRNGGREEMKSEFDNINNFDETDYISLPVESLSTQA